VLVKDSVVSHKYLSMGAVSCSALVVTVAASGATFAGIMCHAIMRSQAQPSPVILSCSAGGGRGPGGRSVLLAPPHLLVVSRGRTTTVASARAHVARVKAAGAPSCFSFLPSGGQGLLDDPDK
jgi:hypothetical protein